MFDDVRRIKDDEIEVFIKEFFKGNYKLDKFKFDDDDNEYFFTLSSMGYEIDGHGRDVKKDGVLSCWFSVTGGDIPKGMRFDGEISRKQHPETAKLMYDKIVRGREDGVSLSTYIPWLRRLINIGRTK